MRWRLLIEEFGPTLHYFPGNKNVVADGLSRLEYDDDDVTPEQFALEKRILTNIRSAIKLS